MILIKAASFWFSISNSFQISNKLLPDYTYWGTPHRYHMIGRNDLANQILLNAQSVMSVVWYNGNIRLCSSLLTGKTYSLHAVFSEKNVIIDKATFRLLGVIIYARLCSAAHVKNLVNTTCQSSCHGLTKMKRYGVAKYIAPQHGSQISPTKSKEHLETTQRLALKIIYPELESYEQRLTISKLERLMILRWCAYYMHSSRPTCIRTYSLKRLCVKAILRLIIAKLWCPKAQHHQSLW